MNRTTLHNGPFIVETETVTYMLCDDACRTTYQAKRLEMVRYAQPSFTIYGNEAGIIEMLKPKKALVISMSYLDATPSRYR
jgi:hypothetical protein